MEYKIKILNDGDDEQYERFIDSHKASMIYHSLKYKKLLLNVINGSSAIYLGAFKNDELVGILPSIIKETKVGCVINSLPFYGSNGGILTSSNNSHLIKRKLFNEIKNISLKKNSLSTVIIESLILKKNHKIEIENESIIFDERYSQITYFNDINFESIEESLMNIFHSKTRNMIRKSYKSNIKISHGSSSKYFDNLINLHNLNIQKKNGQAKPEIFFESLNKLFDYNKDYRIYSATIDNKVVASLLILYFKDHVEYFTPAIDERYKSLQPLSGIIFQSMIDAIKEKNAKLWNWGGTHIDQDSLFKFKSKWGSTNKIYKYTILANETILRNAIKKFDLFGYFEYFYIYPKKYL